MKKEIKLYFTDDNVSSIINLLKSSRTELDKTFPKTVEHHMALKKELADVDMLIKTFEDVKEDEFEDMDGISGINFVSTK